jgi:nucleotide-binding universal stress UspA family protein
MAYTSICVAVALQRYVDLTPLAVKERDIAALLAQEHGAPVHVVSVDAPVPLLPDVDTTADKVERLVEPLVALGISVTTEVRQGRPSQEIRACAEALAADLLIIGSHSKRGPLDVGLGSTASTLVRDISGTVLMVRPSHAEQEQARELMIPRYPWIFPYG